MHTFTVDGLDNPLRVVRFSGHEALSQPYKLEISLAGEEHDLAPGQIVGRPAVLAIDAGNTLPEPRLIHGVVSRVAHADAGRTQTEYVVTLVPAMSRLRLRTDSRIFQGLTVPEILADVFERAGFLRASLRGEARRARASSGYEARLAGTYRPRENCVQYRESDWDFVNRLMEEEGIHYFFEHDESSHVLVITDMPSEHAPIAAGPEGDDAIPYRPGGGALSPGEHVSRFHFAEEVRPDRVVVSDYSFERPMLRLTQAAQLDAGRDASPFEVFEHPGDYDVPEAGSNLSQLRLEELQASRWTGDGDSDSPRLSPGHTFVLTEHPSTDLDRRYLVTRVEHRWSEGGTAPASYACRFEVMPSDVAFRPPRRTPRPIVHGIQTAIVVGPPGEEIHTDEHGRIKVRFHWDRSGRDDDRCSCWMRVAQASAGAAWGSLFLPRVGNEVVVDFLEGDPDRPLVTGSVYHGANVPPYALPAERTKTTIKTSSSPGGGGSNELRFEDRKGAEEVYLHAQKDLSTKVEHDRTEHVGHHETLHVGGTRTTHVTEFDNETVLLAQTVTVGGAQAVTVGAAMALTVGAAKSEMVGLASIEGVGLKKSTTVGLSYSASAGTNISMRSGESTSFVAGKNLSGLAVGNVSLEAGKNMSSLADGKVSVTAGDGMSVAVTGNHTENATENRTLIVGEKLVLQCGDGKITVDKEGNITVEGKSITVTGQGPIAIDGKELNVKSKGPVVVEASGKVTVKGASVGIN